ncbi:MAG: DM13 domain-containing protein [Anaerolineae bacterium]|nr:DM13 domain-containing protein [Anaerolineae bacterium]
MNNRLRILIILLGMVLVAATFTFPYWQPLFNNQVVEEVFPGLSAEQQVAFGTLPAEMQRAYQEMRVTSEPMALEMARSALSGDVIVSTAEQGMPNMTDPVIITSGRFTEVDLLHKGEGSAIIYRLPDNSQILRLEDFRVTNGPTLRVILTTRPEPRTPEEVGTDYVDLGPLKGNVGNQNYSVPSEVDFTRYQGVVIYSPEFRVVFSSADVGTT